jgi:hypothetical protein
MKYKAKKIKNYKRLLKTSSSMPSLFPKTRKDLKDFGSFTKYMDKQLLNYNLDQKDLGETQSILNSTGMRLRKNEIQFINAMKSKNQMFNLKNDPNTYNSTFMTVSVKNNFYENPLHSLNVLKRNNSIAHDIVKYNLLRQKSIFDDTIKEIELDKKFYKKKMPFIKISTLMPKMKKDYAFLSLKKNNNEEKNNNNSNAGNKDSELNNSKTKKNKVSRIYKIGGGDKLANPYTKLICLYRYSFKNFPESR